MSLQYDTLISEGVVRARGALPSGEPITSSPITSTLIYGAAEAVLVDPPFTKTQTQGVIDWVLRSGKKLRYIYVTHGHGDHWFGAGAIIDRFPGAEVYATPGTIEVMHLNATIGRDKVFDPDFPNQIGPTPVLAKPIPPEGFVLEGYRLIPVEVGHTDTEETTVLHVPDIDLIVAGDVVYNGVHQYLSEVGHDGFDDWLTALDKVEALGARHVVAGHKNASLPDSPDAIDKTRRYIADAKRLLAKHPTPEAYYEEMLTLYPDHLNRGPLWYSGVALLAGTPA